MNIRRSTTLQTGKENHMTHESTPFTVTLGARYAEAVAYASQLHATQTRKTTAIPYISHLLGVSSLVLEAGGDEDMAIAALLHDGPEDQGGQATLDEIRQRFGTRVAHIVEGCTDSLAEDPEDKAPWKQRKIAYLQHLQEADLDTLTVSLADKLHNARAIVTDLMIHGDITWERFSGKKDGTLWYYRSILDVALKSNAPQFLQVNLQDAVTDMDPIQLNSLDGQIK
jgi:(p)ppGpp synthase/HD superfamily hydrolase